MVSRGARHSEGSHASSRAGLLFLRYAFPVDTSVSTAIGVLFVAALAGAGWMYYNSESKSDSKSTKKSFSGQSNKGRRVAYRAELGHGDTVTMVENGTAVFWRRGQELGRFNPTYYQLSKIRSGHGELFIYLDQLKRPPMQLRA